MGVICERYGCDRRVEGAGGGQYSVSQPRLSVAVGSGQGQVVSIATGRRTGRRHGRAGRVGARGIAGGRERDRGHTEREANRLPPRLTAITTAAANGFTPAILSGGLQL